MEVERYDDNVKKCEPLYVGMDLTIASFDSISEVNMDYTITMYLNQYWKDERLSFSNEDEILTLSGDFAEKIWVPDTFFANDKNSFLHDVTERNKLVRLNGDGSITYGMRFTTTLACMMDLHYYPLDSQNCTVEIESYGYTVSDVVMYWKDTPVRGVEEAELPQFTIIGYETNDRKEKLATGNYQRLSLSFKLQRNIGYFVFQTYLPSILIVMLSWVSFWINHEATSARVALVGNCGRERRRKRERNWGEREASGGLRSPVWGRGVQRSDVQGVLCPNIVGRIRNLGDEGKGWEKEGQGITTVLTMTTISTGVRSSLPRISYVKAIDIYLVMCFVFVFAALLEYAAVNYTYWGARAKKKSKKTKEAEGKKIKQGSKPGTSAPTVTDDIAGATSTEQEIIELQDLRMSPIPSIRNRHTSRFSTSSTEGLDSTKFPPSFRMSRSQAYGFPARSASGLRFRGSRTHLAHATGQRPKMFSALKRGASALRASIPKIRDVNMIDKYSRIIFPVSFMIFNAVYWIFYFLPASNEVK
uniref:Gamma-aminobutyric acid receptor subunit beta n=1 Tax=Timema genevievae TaxID=629358 RepID=A0A7R9K0K3_TIMGE|nr:unnamed protein product [Timema genevievae]